MSTSRGITADADNMEEGSCSSDRYPLLLLLVYDIFMFARAIQITLAAVHITITSLLQVIPQLQGDATDQTPPDLPSYLFKERIVYLVCARPAMLCYCCRHCRATNLLFLCRGVTVLFCMQGMSLVPAVTELLLAELLYLQYDNPTRPIFMYINSAGVQVSRAWPQGAHSGL